MRHWQKNSVGVSDQTHEPARKVPGDAQGPGLDIAHIAVTRFAHQVQREAIRFNGDACHEVPVGLPRVQPIIVNHEQ